MSKLNSYSSLPTLPTFSKIEPAFQFPTFSCSRGYIDSTPNIIPMSFGAQSKVIGKCFEIRSEQGQCIGNFKSEDVDTWDPEIHPSDPTSKPKYPNTLPNTYSNTHLSPLSPMFFLNTCNGQGNNNKTNTNQSNSKPCTRVVPMETAYKTPHSKEFTIDLPYQGSFTEERTIPLKYNSLSVEKWDIQTDSFGKYAWNYKSGK